VIVKVVQFVKVVQRIWTVMVRTSFKNGRWWLGEKWVTLEAEGLD